MVARLASEVRANLFCEGALCQTSDRDDWGPPHTAAILLPGSLHTPAGAGEVRRAGHGARAQTCDDGTSHAVRHTSAPVPPFAFVCLH